MKQPIRTLIVDDEPLARRSLRLLLDQDAEVRVVGECDDGRAAAEAIVGDQPDLVFLDVQMPEMDGFEVLETVGDAASPIVVFVTAYDEHAIRAFEYHALDYLLKPFADQRFADTLARAKAELRRTEMARLGHTVAAVLDEQSRGLATQPGERGTPMRRFVLRSGGRLQFLPAAKVDWIEAADYYVRIHVGNRGHLLRHSMKELESRLDREQFVRIHRSAIVNVERIRELHEGFNGSATVVLQDGTELPVSRRQKRRLEWRVTGR